VFARNYFNAYLEYHTRGRDDEKLRTFLRCKLEAERFVQHTGAPQQASSGSDDGGLNLRV
jgi:hypothetical protein